MTHLTPERRREIASHVDQKEGAIGILWNDIDALLEDHDVLLAENAALRKVAQAARNYACGPNGRTIQTRKVLIDALAALDGEKEVAMSKPHPEIVVLARALLATMTDPAQWDRLPENSKEDWCRYATNAYRHVLASLMEPSDAMHAAGHIPFSDRLCGVNDVFIAMLAARARELGIEI